MKSFLLGLMLILTVNVSAHHITPLGWCPNGLAMFKTVQFSNNLNVQTRYKIGNNGEWLNGPSFNTPVSGNTTIVFSVPQTNSTQQVFVSFRYKQQTSNNYGSWSSPTSSITSTYNGCTTLPIKFQYLNVSQIDSKTILVEFKALESNGESKFNIQISTDSREFKTLAVISPDAILPDKIYKIKIKI